MGDIGARLEVVRQRIADAASRVGRDPGDVELVAVSKTKTVAETAEAVAAGVEALGENYVQELLKKREAVGDTVRWHFIGHLQTNKVKYLVPFCELIHGVDSLKVAGEISKRAVKLERKQPVLIEVNLGGEDTKFGAGEQEALELAPNVAELPGVELRGLMTMPPYSDNPEDSRPQFARLRELAERLPEECCRELSMGMTGDFEVAIEEGATIVRVGTAIFGPRH